MLVFEVSSQNIKCTKKPSRDLVENQLNFIVCNFVFSNEWLGLHKIAQFRQDGLNHKYNVELGTQDIVYCNLPSGLRAGNCYVSVLGYKQVSSGSITDPDDGEIIETYKTIVNAETNGYVLKIAKSGFVKDFDLDIELDQSPDKSYIHLQRVASSKWAIKHDLDKYPSVMVIDSAGTNIVGDVKYVDKNNLIIIFSSIMSGYAFLN